MAVSVTRTIASVASSIFGSTTLSTLTCFGLWNTSAFIVPPPARPGGQRGAATPASALLVTGKPTTCPAALIASPPPRPLSLRSGERPEGPPPRLCKPDGVQVSVPGATPGLVGELPT